MQYESEMQPVSYKNFVGLYALGNNIIRDVPRDAKVILIDSDRELNGS